MPTATATATKKKAKPRPKRTPRTGFMAIVSEALERAADNARHARKILTAHASKNKGLAQWFIKHGIYHTIGKVRHDTRARALSRLTTSDEPWKEPTALPAPGKVDPGVRGSIFDYRLHGSGIPIGDATHGDILDAIEEIRRNVDGLKDERRFLQKVESAMRDKGSKTVEKVLTEGKLEGWFKSAA